MESPIPGMLLKDYIAAGSSKEYKDYAFFATNPDKRIGVPAGQIEEAKRVYEEKYPLMAKHYRKWILFACSLPARGAPWPPEGQISASLSIMNQSSNVINNQPMNQSTIRSRPVKIRA